MKRRRRLTTLFSLACCLASAAGAASKLSRVPQSEKAKEAPKPQAKLPDPQKMSQEEFFKQAEHIFYDMSNTTRMDDLQSFIDRRLEVSKNDPYTWWARARVAFFKKEAIYLKEKKERMAGGKNDFLDEKLALAADCQKHNDECFKLTETNAECYLMRGGCYAMEISAIGPSFSVLPKLKKMDHALQKALELPSNMLHVDGKLTTAQMGMVMRGVLYRILPDSFWFYLIAGVRGNKHKAYDWINQAIPGKLDQEPMFVLELAAVDLCVGKEDKDEKKVAEGLRWIEAGLKLPIRHAMDGFDQQNMYYLKANPKEACNYRRERFEDAGAKLQNLSEKKEKETSQATP